MTHSQYILDYMAGIGLSQAQQAARRGKLTASRLPVLMSGDEAKIYSLWAELTGRQVPDNLDEVWHVRLGNATEHLNIWWYEKTTGRPTSMHGDVVQHIQHPWLSATLDAADEAYMAAVECKHVTLRNGRTLDDVVQHYQPQCQSQMLITGWPKCMLSIAVDTSPPAIFEIEADPDYQAALMGWARWFWAFVDADQPPVTPPSVPPPPPSHDKMRIVDMSAGNRAADWEAASRLWIANKEAAKVFDGAAKSVKEMMPDDARRAYGAGIEAIRNRRGAVSIKEMADADQ